MASNGEEPDYDSGPNEDSVGARKSLPHAPPPPYIPPPLPPVSLPPSMPQRNQMVATAKTQKYIGNILNNNNRRPPPMMGQSYGTPSTAPPAAKQVARTAKIIGNILSFDKGRRKR